MELSYVFGQNRAVKRKKYRNELRAGKNAIKKELKDKQPTEQRETHPRSQVEIRLPKMSRKNKMHTEPSKSKCTKGK